MELTALNEIIRSRRSIYPQQYTREIIPDNLIMTLLENAHTAPTHKLTQPWRFTVFTGPGLKKLGDFQADLYKRLEGEKCREQKYLNLKQKPLQASHVIAIGLKRHAIVPLEEEVAAVACAVQNMYLTATASGLGCYWGSGGITYAKEALPFFDLNEEDKLLGFFYLGYPIKTPPSVPRAPLEDHVAWVRE